MERWVENWEKKRSKHQLGRKFGEEVKGEEETTFPVPLISPYVTVWLFLLSSLASSFFCPFDGTALQNLFSPPSLSSFCVIPNLSTPITSFSAPFHFAEGSTRECHVHSHGWRSPKSPWSRRVCFRISLCYPRA